MEKQELVLWVAGQYFASWELERAQEVVLSDGYTAGIHYLVKGCRGRGYAGPGNPTYFKVGKGKVECYYPDSSFVGQPADVVVSLTKLARIALVDPRQPRLF